MYFVLQPLKSIQYSLIITFSQNLIRSKKRYSTFAKTSRDTLIQERSAVKLVTVDGVYWPL